MEDYKKLKCYCNYCDTYFDVECNENDIVCPQCGVGIVTKNSLLMHPANKSMSTSIAKEIISWLGWCGFKKVCPAIAKIYPELRPIKKS